MVTNRNHQITRRGDQADRQMEQGAGRRTTGACKARVRFGRRLLLVCTALSISMPAKLWALSGVAPPTATSFAYRISHPVTPLPDSVFERIADPENAADAAFEEDMTKEAEAGTPRFLPRSELCSMLASVAQANELPVPFFANLIWHESSFNTATISRAGAQGIAQFMPRTAAMYDLINPFEPVHAITVAGKFLRELHQQFGNLGLAAAAYNAGPRRVSEWIAGRGALPAETRRYVVKITGRPAEHWLQGKAQTGPEALLMPAKAPCVEVAVAVEEQVQRVRVARLMGELAEAAAQTKRLAENDRTAGDGETRPSKPVPPGKKGNTRVAKADVKQARKQSAKSENVSAARKEAKADTKADATSVAKSEARPAVKSEVKTAARSSAKSDGKPKVEAEIRVALKPEPKSKPETKDKPEAEDKSKAEAKVAAQPDAKPDAGSAAPDPAKDAEKKDAGKDTGPAEAKDTTAAEKDPQPRRKAVRRARVAFDRHTGNW
jgi:soluble lytic murein transglycosylase-like protein